MASRAERRAQAQAASSKMLDAMSTEEQAPASGFTQPSGPADPGPAEFKIDLEIDTSRLELRSTRDVLADEIDEDPEDEEAPSLDGSGVTEAIAHDERAGIERAARHAGWLEAASYVESDFDHKVAKAIRARAARIAR